MRLFGGFMRVFRFMRLCLSQMARLFKGFEMNFEKFADVVLLISLILCSIGIFTLMFFL